MKPTDATLAYYEDIVSGYACGRFKSTELDRHLRGRTSLLIPPDVQAALEDAVTAWWAWTRAETGDYDIHSLEPDLQNEEVYAERCRCALEDTLAELVRTCRASFPAKTAGNETKQDAA